MSTPHPAEALLAAFAEEHAVDATCHLGQWPFRLGAAADADAARAYARRHGLSSLWVSHLACLFGFDTRTGNEACFDACADDDLFAVFAVLDPSDPTWLTELDWAVQRGALGVRIAPGAHGYALRDAVEVAEACRARDIPLQILVRLDDARVRHPRHPMPDPQPDEIARFLRAAEGTRLLVSGVRWDEWEETMRHLPDLALRDVSVDLWHVNGPLNIADRFADAPGRWVFGSGFPVQTPEATMLQITASALTADERAQVARGNAARLLAGT